MARLAIWQAEFGHAKMLSLGFEVSPEELAQPYSSRRSNCLDVSCLNHDCNGVARWAQISWCLVADMRLTTP